MEQRTIDQQALFERMNKSNDLTKIQNQELEQQRQNMKKMFELQLEALQNEHLKSFDEYEKEYRKEIESLKD